MAYKKKLTILLILVGVLALIYISSFVFDSGKKRSDAFSWLDPALLGSADKIEISGSGGMTVLSRKNNTWVFSAGAEEYPAKQDRVEDFLSRLTRKESYALRAASSEARERLGLSENSASRVIIRGGAGLPLLDLLIGTADALGREIYLRRADKNEIYSGEDRLTLYVDSKPQSWYNLRLFTANTTVEMVQQAEVVISQDTYMLRRSGGGWIMTGNNESTLDSPKVDAWLRSVLEAEGEDFSAGFAVNASPALVEGRITLRFGDGTTRTIQTGPPDEQKRRDASVTGSSLVYVLAEWTYNRLFRESAYFVKSEN